MRVSGCHIPEDAYCQSIDLECYNSCLDGHVGKVYRGGCRSLARYCIVLISKTKANKCWNQALLCPEDVTSSRTGPMLPIIRSPKLSQMQMRNPSQGMLCTSAWLSRTRVAQPHSYHRIEAVANRRPWSIV